MLTAPYHIAIPTAFYSDESLNTKATIAYIKSLYNQGVASVLVCGTTGEQHSMNIEEKLALLETLSLEKALLENMEIIFGVSAIRQTEATQLATAIKQVKIAGILVGFPPYLVPTQNEAIQYARDIVQHCQKPTILYNNPRRTGFNLTTESLIELSQEGLIVGLKEAGDMYRVPLLKSELSESFSFYAGGELDLAEKVQLGFNRLSSITGNLKPLAIGAWFFSLLNNKPITMQEHNEVLELINETLTGSALPYIKQQLNQAGFNIGICRRPLGQDNLDLKETTYDNIN
ncbi:4-hydroxy-tetrahydrodipicolinate synthase [Amphibacillus marinus]|uniref:4-hydroxy-tetrahydrodipicolinate synthase n=1 Tax=Amphibacillus marinus TaxID=872970 RepID=A0A1H8K7I2_9BACI|nr:dihydrodipicolinate synthase family protein [Amphibacillus marinus]SEN88970.1 4-hydroxy-tetrahydrodipicolinate synthase [Amphibacillus marinus]